MNEIDVVAVMGPCVPERERYAARLAKETGRPWIPAARLSLTSDPLDEALALLPWFDSSDGVVLEFPSRTPAPDVIGAFSDAPARLVGLVCVIDAPHLLDDLGRDDYFQLPAPDGGTLFLSRALATATQIEYASTVVLAGWETLDTPRLSLAMAIVSALGPTARLRLHPSPVSAPEERVRFSATQDRPGWLRVLNDDHAPHMTDERVSAFRYEQARPFHPERLSRVLDDRIEPGEFGVVLRSAGFCRFATRPGITGHWEHVGKMISFQPLAADDDLRGDEADGELLAPGQELGIIGLGLDGAGLAAALDHACLTDDELLAGPEAWADFPDPFPQWHAAGIG